MKKVLAILLCFVVILMPGCSKKQNSNGNKTVKSAESIQIQDNTFITQCNDIYKNPDNYKDKLIVVQGMYNEATISGTVHHYVTRHYVPQNSSGTLASVGFEINYNGDFPSAGNWIKVYGFIEPITTNGTKSVILNVSNLDELQEKGVEIVSN
ncbi:MAG: hypothetical protein FWC47_08265 [Oscillospiraceae bacterium]|nr:hypothetical protein [Oscillospiraceae bacterium]